MKPTIRVYAGAAELAEAAAELFVSAATEAIATRGHFSVVLSGGKTPVAFHRKLASSDYVGRLDWSTVHLFWGDERSVPPDSPDSNFRMARETLLDAVSLPSVNIHRIHGEADPATAAADYERELRAFCAAQPDGGTLPCFDLVYLGIGEDGHTASLFPNSSALAEGERWVVAAPHDTPPLPSVPRITLTPSALNNAARVAFIVSGKAKAERLAQIVSGRRDPSLLPAQLIRLPHGELIWLLDAEAAQFLPPTPVP